jgi:hypothetical protein
MIVLEAISLRRNYGTVVLDKMPNESEFRALAVMLRGVDQLLAGEQPTVEFTETFVHHPAVEQARLRYVPAAGRIA